LFARVTAGSPWAVEVLSADEVRTTAHELGLLLNNQPASFEIYTNREAEGRLNVTITGQLTSRQNCPTVVKQ